MKKLKRYSSICSCCPRYRQNVKSKPFNGRCKVHKELCRELNSGDSLILNERQGEFIKEDCSYRFEHIIYNGNDN